VLNLAYYRQVCRSHLMKSLSLGTLLSSYWVRGGHCNSQAWHPVRIAKGLITMHHWTHRAWRPHSGPRGKTSHRILSIEVTNDRERSGSVPFSVDVNGSTIRTVILSVRRDLMMCWHCTESATTLLLFTSLCVDDNIVSVCALE
jgi:hypothetical protein